jgi:hypothetical protein
MATLRRWSGSAPPPSFIPPPRLRDPFTPLLPIKAEDPLYLRVVSHQVTSLFTHFVDGRTLPCTAHTGQCWLDHAHVPTPDWQGWLLCWIVDADHANLVRLTPGCVEHEPLLADRSVDLRGMEVAFWRKTYGRCNRMFAQVGAADDRIEPPMGALDVYALVLRLFGGRDKTPEDRRRDKVKASTMLRDQMAKRAEA